MLTIKGKAKNGHLMPHELELTNNGVELKGVTSLTIHRIEPNEPVVATLTMQVHELDLDAELTRVQIEPDLVEEIQ